MVEGADIPGHEIHLISTLSCVSFPAGQQIGDQSGLASKLIPLMPMRVRELCTLLLSGSWQSFLLSLLRAAGACTVPSA